MNIARALQQRTERLEAAGSIAESSVDFTITNPEVLRNVAGHLIAYSSAVEGEIPTTVAVIHTLLPDMSEDLHRFVDIWGEQEHQHGVLLNAVRCHADIPALQMRDEVPASIKLAGLLGKLSPGLHDTSAYLYLVEAALGERETIDFYGHTGEILFELGEAALAHTLFRPIRTQESWHLGYYRQAALAQYERLSPAQRFFAKEFVTKTYRPVGVRFGRRNQQRSIDFGHTAVDLTHGDIQPITDPVEALAAELLHQTVDSMPPFTRKQYQVCMERYRDSLTTQ